MEFDNLIHQRFGQLHNARLRVSYGCWRNTALELHWQIIVIDQFSLVQYLPNMPIILPADPIALVLAQNAILQKFDQN